MLPLSLWFTHLSLLGCCHGQCGIQGSEESFKDYLIRLGRCPVKAWSNTRPIRRNAVSRHVSQDMSAPAGGDGCVWQAFEVHRSMSEHLNLLPRNVSQGVSGGNARVWDTSGFEDLNV